MKIVICTIKSWNIKEANKFKKKWETVHDITIIDDKNSFNYHELNLCEPDFIFFPHWSYIIPREIYEKWNCIVFHMTDLPYGRGGSPLQNLIVRGFSETKISAIKVNNIIDGGPIYLKENLNLNGTADEILMRCSKIVFEKMIPKILNNNITPLLQKGEAIPFVRRTSEQSKLDIDMSLEQIYDYIRMLDGEGYPQAFISFGKYKLLFSRASFKGNRIIADVEISEENDE